MVPCSLEFGFSILSTPCDIALWSLGQLRMAHPASADDVKYFPAPDDFLARLNYLTF